ncbi:hypothetical protein DSM14862_01102 [Sulfitobacter indolifex]|uniref:UDP-N-acetylmuramate--alanine ligase n=1 Tax=Sulfitobacter indolifex HEL-45 TaxID=391624 RepID=A0ABP2DBW6_9RHOB|nr:DUF2484 family protein [Sulfitobacter indolifex]EDQ05288.1 hypothetical protein OIHEL45_11113 [Sulfitobacter indolifex HEL-45]UOA18337.1 hypothetical protein DSM14862_01102 [Sulfitobacter indolifex]
MTLVWLSILWVFAAVTVAMLPLRSQYLPGVMLLIAAPALIIAIGMTYSWALAMLALLAFLSMFRNPLRYLWARLRGRKPELPK